MKKKGADYSLNVATAGRRQKNDLSLQCGVIKAPYIVTALQHIISLSIAYSVHDLTLEDAAFRPDNRDAAKTLLMMRHPVLAPHHQKDTMRRDS